MKRFMLTGIAVLAIILSFVGSVSAQDQSCSATDPNGNKQTLPEGTQLNGWMCKNGQWVIPSSQGPVATEQATKAEIPRKAKAELFQSPVQCTSKFNNESSLLLCEPGVLLDASTAWTIPGTDQMYSVNIPEGGFTYFSLGGGTITVDGVSISLKFEKGLNYLVLIRGRIDDGIVDSDLNITAQVSGFKPGHAIWSHMPTGAYVSKDWFRQQLVASTTKGYTNCGATGCSRVRIVLFDVDSHFFQEFETRAGAIDTWTLIASN